MNSNLIETIRPILEKEGVIQPGLSWNELTGGRSNYIWRVGDKVCKLYQRNRSSDLFPNNPNTEQKILKFLKGSFIAPEFVYFNEISIGYILVYKFVDGPVCIQPSEKIAKTLSRLHAISSKNLYLKRRNSSSKYLLIQCEKFLRGTSLENLSLPIDPKIENSNNLSIIHCDPVPGNAILYNNDAILIDWQCCAIGDGSEDIACALSPAMQYLYGKGELSFKIREQFLKTYSHRKTVERYKLLGQIYHFRIAAYCFWRAKKGEKDYEDAFLKEKKYLNTVYK